jgi:tetratricopeptide (TPR) repeat protein
LDLSRSLHDPYHTPTALVNLGEARQHQGHLQQALLLYRESLSLFRELGDKRAIAYTLGLLGRAVFLDGHTADASQLLEESVLLAHELGDKATVADCLEGLATVALARGDAVRAIRVFGAADTLREVIGTPLAPSNRADRDRQMATARDRIDATAVEAAWDAGRALSLREAIAEAILAAPRGTLTERAAS